MATIHYDKDANLELIAVRQDATGRAQSIGLAYARGIGGPRGGVREAKKDSSNPGR